MLYADLLQSAAVDLQEIIHRADLVALNVRNIIYTERAKEKRKAI
jgi:hypothetical protein